MGNSGNLKQRTSVQCHYSSLLRLEISYRQCLFTRNLSITIKVSVLLKLVKFVCLLTFKALFRHIRWCWEEIAVAAMLTVM